MEKIEGFYNGIFYSLNEDALNQIKKDNEEFDSILMWGKLSPYWKEPLPHKYEDDCFMAYVFINGKQESLRVNKLDMKGYKIYSLEESPNEWYKIKIPLEEVKYDKFERWYRSMDF